ncbi:DUF1206 domain-containing protein [Planosporangium mesophilum]|uniref:DUF1206 domain-containing protein n=1 Tax=Planosporangium mesophilum TaxID=689768 RepID=A0A8J3TGU1_9ACTN|nr:DUF1206 domain-containing protein [Planosporangium mesophilum]NJC82419.1 DUF1206 domain-containing protein [Planosporangium mesophilum]GII26203.1 hypothetical protein Pme01_58000 [Planosporangium mesophilum]
MTVVHSARRTAHRAARSDILEVLTRIGFVGYGLLHLTVAWIAAQIALGHPTGEGDQAGAFRYLAEQPFGRFSLMVSVVGLAAMAVWQLLLAFVGHRQERGFSRTAERVASAVRAVVYAGLAWTAYKVVVGSPTSQARQAQEATAGVMAHPAGRWLVGLAGVVVVAIGIGLMAYGARRAFCKRLMLGRMSRSARRTATVLGEAGYIAKGIAFGIVGVLLCQAASKHNAARARGLDGALRLLVDQPAGPLALLGVATGFAAFGAYCFFQARYRKVGA